MAIAGKITGKQVVVVDDLNFDEIKTHLVVDLLNALSLGGKTALIATEGVNRVVYRSARNIYGVEVLPASDTNALAVLRPDCMLVSKAAMDQLRGGKAEEICGLIGSEIRMDGR